MGALSTCIRAWVQDSDVDTSLNQNVFSPLWQKAVTPVWRVCVRVRVRACVVVVRVPAFVY